MHGLPWYLALVALTSIPGFIHATETSSRTRAVTYTSRRTLAELPRRKALAGRFATEADAWAAPVQVAVKTSHFFGSYARVVDNCNFEGKPIKCEFTERPHQPAPEADALWFHVPSACGSTINRDAPHQLTVAMSMEASTYYSCLDDLTYMDQFDIEMTYRRCSHVQSGYFADGQTLITGTFFKDPLPWASLHSTIAYINSNCGALNGRNDIVNRLMGMNQIPVDAWGQCLRNKVAPNHHFNKGAIFRQYKFCIAMENSNTMDYVSEKVWHALDAGCLPIYYGAPNIEDYVPHPNSIIDYRKYGTPEKLMEYLVMLNGNETAYMQHHAWRQAPPEQLSPGFRKLVMMHMVGAQHSQCTLCGIVMDHRLRGTNLKQTHCLRNQTWMDAVKNGGSSWGPGSDAALSQPWPLKSRSAAVPS